MLLGCIADDFTGASDIANTLAREGMRTRLFIGSVTCEDADCDAGVVALKTRSIPVADAVGQSLTVLNGLRAAGCRQFVFKYCSTFDSTRLGNIGAVAEALATALGVSGVIVCPAFPATGRTVYQGHLFVGDRLLSESGMERHPLTPMVDPDIRRWLALQTKVAPAHIGHSTVREGAVALRAALDETSAPLVVVDALSEADLRMIGEAAMDDALVTGASGIAIGLPENFRKAGLLGGTPSAFVGNRGPALVLSGSCSTTTQAQVFEYAAHRPAIEVDIAALLGGVSIADDLFKFIDSNADNAPLVYSTAEPERVRDLQRRHGADRTAAAVESLFGELARHAVGRGFGRIVVAGGETSGAVVTALGLSALDLGAQIDPGVPALSTRTAAGQPLALALKSGNFGTPDFLSKAVVALGACR